MSDQIYNWIKSGLIKPAKEQHALEVAGERSHREAWFHFIQKALLLFGLLALAFGVIFFFAYNWNEMGRMVKFGLVQLALLAAFVLYFFKAQSTWLAQSLLLTIALLIGAFLALFGQTYQTGADPWQLFATWAMLLLPLVLFSRSEVLWLVLAVLLNLSLELYLQLNQYLFGFKYVWSFLLLNMVLLSLLEWLNHQGLKFFAQIGLPHRWVAQVVALGVLFILTMIGMDGIWGGAGYQGWYLLIYVLLMAAVFGFYRLVRIDLLLLTAWALAVMIFVLSLIADVMMDDIDSGGFLLLAIALIGMSAFTVKWIKQLHQDLNQGAQS